MSGKEGTMRNAVMEALVNKIKTEVMNDLRVSSSRDVEGNYMISVTSRVQDYLIQKLAEARYDLGLEMKKPLDEW